mmetsp:Transcript_25158/g.100114  ORF Transcript_25158/g.100114 Transcript_25158/m.100114 type:complete len:241 (-) Transcript_25158:21-743(-)
MGPSTSAWTSVTARRSWTSPYARARRDSRPSDRCVANFCCCCLETSRSSCPRCRAFDDDDDNAASPLERISAASVVTGGARVDTRTGVVHCSQTIFSSCDTSPKSDRDRRRSKNDRTTAPFRRSGPAGASAPSLLESRLSTARSTARVTELHPTRAYATSKWTVWTACGRKGPGARQNRMVWSTHSKASRASSKPHSSSSVSRSSFGWDIERVWGTPSSSEPADEASASGSSLLLLFRDV